MEILSKSTFAHIDLEGAQKDNGEDSTVCRDIALKTPALQTEEIVAGAGMTAPICQFPRSEI